ncbi:OB-fold nucleic acid binding domain-containing protein [Natronomonas gomsonensis]|uniref:OB-fold nucleic acid binding domain-containing protein n=1 Tax=Natronomonas gomsonensis TaxID=1046043 RepID=UPI0015BACB78|nr:OB-fold nucleic acid binding domain-containing protein [Natronomonas gomsonensis]
MPDCIICGTSSDGPICDVHQEDVVFEFRGDQPSQLTPGRFYRGTVDGYAEFGVFINIGNVTGLLHRSKLDRRLESLDWEVGDDVFVQVNNIRDNGDIDLGWSIRQSEREFRGVLVDSPDGDYLADEYGESDDAESEESDTDASTEESAAEPESGREPETATEEATEDEPTEAKATEAKADEQTGGNPSDEELADIAAKDEPVTEESDAAGSETDEAVGDIDRVPVGTLREHVGDVVRLEGEVVSARQTSGPTVFELRDETGVVDCAAFVEAGVRAYPDIEADDYVRLDGEVRLRRDEIQVETESLVELEADAKAEVEQRMDDALDDQASADSVEPLADDDAIEAITADITDAATTIRRAVLESRPVVVRHDATTDGYVAGAAVERAILPLVKEQHASADAVYHYFDRRPLEDGVYDMNDATKDVTRMLGDRERHDEKLPLFVFAAAGSTAASTDGLELLDIYGAPRVVLDGRPADSEVVDEIDSLVTVADRTATTVAANVAAAVNGDVRDDLTHLPAISYWDDTPEAYVELAAEAGVDDDTARQLREAIALEAFYQSYEDKRELIVDLLFEKRTGLAEQVSEQFGRKLEAELETATANLDERSVDGATVAVLDTEAYTHTYDFPPTRLLLDELARRLDVDAVVGVATDELHIRTDAALDLEAIVASLQLESPEAGVDNPGAREPKLEFLAGEREAVLDTLVDALAEQVVTASA